jgi:putative MATE family efflux protein
VPLLDRTDRRLLRLAGPAFLTLSAEPIYVLVDTAIVGHLGTSALGGLAIAGTILSTVTWLIMFLATGVTTQVGQRRGAGDEAGARRAVSQGFIAALAFGFGTAAVIGSAAHPLSRLIGGKGRILSAAVAYLQIAALGMPAIALALLALGWYRGTENLRLPVRVAIGANVLNVLLEMLFVWVFHWGIRGSAAATVVVQWVAVGVYVQALRGTIALERPRPDAMRALLRIGSALLVRTGMMVSTVTAATWLASRSGAAALGAHQVTMQIYLFCALMVDALAISSQSIFAAQMATRAEGELWPITRRLIRLGLLAGLLLGAVMAVGSPFLGRAFSGDEAVLRNARHALLWCALLQITGAVTFVLDGVLMGADLFTQLAIGALGAAASFWVIVLVTHGPLPVHGLGGVWLALNVWMAIRAVGNLGIARRNLRQGRRPPALAFRP